MNATVLEVLLKLSCFFVVKLGGMLFHTQRARKFFLIEQAVMIDFKIVARNPALLPLFPSQLRTSLDLGSPMRIRMSLAWRARSSQLIDIPLSARSSTALSTLIESSRMDKRSLISRSENNHGGLLSI